MNEGERGGGGEWSNLPSSPDQSKDYRQGDGGEREGVEERGSQRVDEEEELLRALQAHMLLILLLCLEGGKEKENPK